MSEVDQNDRFEQALRKALRPVDAPETLARFLMAAAEVEAERELPRRERKRRWAWSVSHGWFGAASFATAALLLVVVLGGERLHQRHLREAEATREFETATRITDQALEHAREQLARAGVSLEQ
jgi:hypothetical protein